MKLRTIAINNLLDASIGKIQEYGTVSEEIRDKDEDDPDIQSAIQFRLTLLRGKNSIEISLEDIQTKVITPCNRCNSPLEKDIHIPTLSATYFIHPEKEDENEAQDNYTVDLKKASIDLSAPLRNEIFLQIDPFQLCSPECKGICQQCGSDLNEKECSCEKAEEASETENTPLAALKEMVSKKEE